MTRDGGCVAGRHADTEVFYMAGKQLAALARRLLAAGWPTDTPGSSCRAPAGPTRWPATTPSARSARAAMLHAGRPTVVIVGAGARGRLATLAGDADPAPPTAEP